MSNFFIIPTDVFTRLPSHESSPSLCLQHYPPGESDGRQKQPIPLSVPWTGIHPGVTSGRYGKGRPDPVDIDGVSWGSYDPNPNVHPSCLC